MISRIMDDGTRGAIRAMLISSLRLSTVHKRRDWHWTRFMNGWCTIFHSLLRGRIVPCQQDGKIRSDTTCLCTKSSRKFLMRELESRLGGFSIQICPLWRKQEEEPILETQKCLRAKETKLNQRLGQEGKLKSNLLILHHKFNSLFRYSICNGLPNIKEENHDPHEQFQFQRPRSHSVNSSVSSQNSYTSFDHITKDDLNFIDFLGKNGYQVPSSNDLCYDFTSNLKFVEENLLL